MKQAGFELDLIGTAVPKAGAAWDWPGRGAHSLAS